MRIGVEGMKVYKANLAEFIREYPRYDSNLLAPYLNSYKRNRDLVQEIHKARPDIVEKPGTFCISNSRIEALVEKAQEVDRSDQAVSARVHLSRLHPIEELALPSKEDERYVLGNTYKIMVADALRQLAHDGYRVRMIQQNDAVRMQPELLITSSLRKHCKERHALIAWDPEKQDGGTQALHEFGWVSRYLPLATANQENQHLLVIQYSAASNHNLSWTRGLQGFSEMLVSEKRGDSAQTLGTPYAFEVRGFWREFLEARTDWQRIL